MPAPNWTSNNVTEVAITGRWTNGRPVVNIIHVRREEDDPAQSARDVLNNWQDHVMDEIPNNYVLESARYRDRNSALGVVGTILPDAAKPLTGGTGTASMSPNVAVLVHKVTETTVGQKNGRMFLPGALEGFVDEDGALEPTYRANIQGKINLFFDGLSGALDNELVVVHFAGAFDATGTASTVTELAVDGRVATQRRRLRK